MSLIDQLQARLARKTEVTVEAPVTVVEPTVEAPVVVAAPTVVETPVVEVTATGTFKDEHVLLVVGDYNHKKGCSLLEGILVGKYDDMDIVVHALGASLVRNNFAADVRVATKEDTVHVRDFENTQYLTETCTKEKLEDLVTKITSNTLEVVKTKVKSLKALESAVVDYDARG